jgi:hypothetical protein
MKIFGNKALVYLIGTDANLNGNMSIYDGKVLLQIKNYTQVHASIPAEIPPDCRVYPVLVPSDQVVTLNEGSGDILRVWQGPKEGRQYPHTPVQAELYTLYSPLADLSDTEIEKKLDGALSKISELVAANKALADQVDSLTSQTAALKDPDIKVLAEVMRRCSDEVLVALPHIGEETLPNLRKFITKVIKG